MSTVSGKVWLTTGLKAMSSQRIKVMALLGDYDQLILLRLAQNTEIYLHKLQHKLHGLFGVTIHVPTIGRTLHRMGVAEE